MNAAARLMVPGALAKAFALKRSPSPQETPAPVEGPVLGPRPVRPYSEPAEPIEAIVERWATACLALAERYDHAVITYTGRPLAPEAEGPPDWGSLAGGRIEDDPALSPPPKVLP